MRGETVRTLNIPFDAEEWEAFRILAQRHMRPWKLEARYLLRQALGLEMAQSTNTTIPGSLSAITPGFTVQLADIDGAETGFADTWMTSVPHPGDTVYTEYDGNEEQWKVKNVDWLISPSGDVIAGLRLKKITG